VDVVGFHDWFSLPWGGSTAWSVATPRPEPSCGVISNPCEPDWLCANC